MKYLFFSNWIFAWYLYMFNIITIYINRFFWRLKITFFDIFFSKVQHFFNMIYLFLKLNENLFFVKIYVTVLSIIYLLKGFCSYLGYISQFFFHNMLFLFLYYYLSDINFVNIFLLSLYFFSEYSFLADCLL